MIERYGIRAEIMLSFTLYDSPHLPWSLVSVSANGEAEIHSVSQSQASYCVQGRGRCQGRWYMSSQWELGIHQHWPMTGRDDQTIMCRCSNLPDIPPVSQGRVSQSYIFNRNVCGWYSNIPCSLKYSKIYSHRYKYSAISWFMCDPPQTILHRCHCLA